MQMTTIFSIISISAAIIMATMTIISVIFLIFGIIAIIKNLILKPAVGGYIIIRDTLEARGKAIWSDLALILSLTVAILLVTLAILIVGGII